MEFEKPIKLRSMPDILRMANTLALEASNRKDETTEDAIGRLMLETQVNMLQWVLSLEDKPTSCYRRHG